ncbi:MAG: GDP-mannose 4,6-dehydratase, partial [Euryarchaeota archaeon]|nr:GDP-mannose 4,6-dehydratase [Euryarchaeota archaeon]
NGEQTRDFIHVSDVVAALMGIAKSLMENGVGSPCHSQAYNICTGNAVTLNQVVSVLEKLNGEEINVTYEAIRRGDIKESSGTSKKLQQTLEWAPKVSLDFGLKELLI